MERKKSWVAAAAVFAAMAMIQLPATASADCEVMEADIEFVGYRVDGEGGMVVIRLIDLAPDGERMWNGTRTFRLDERLGNAGYATLLTAFSLDKTLRIRVRYGTCAPGDFITHVFINR